MPSEEVQSKDQNMRFRITRPVIVRKSDLAIKYVSLIVLVVQNASQVLIMRYVRTRRQEMFLSTVAVFVTEIVKLIACFIFVCFEEKSILKCFNSMYNQIVRHPIDTLKVCLPAILYVVQNNLLYIAISNLPAATFMVSYQLKILTTAFFTVLILRRPLSLLQWIALILLFSGIALVQMDEQKAKENTKLLMALNETSISQTTQSPQFTHIAEQSPLKGFIAVLGACFLSGFAGIYFEKILKTTDISVWIRNVQLAIVSLPVGLANVFIQDRTKVLERGFLIGFDVVVWIMIMISSLGGLTVAVVMKYADNILKAFATSIAIILACIVSAVLFAFRPSYLFILGTALVICAVFMYGMFPYKKKYEAPMEPLTPTNQTQNQELQELTM